MTETKYRALLSLRLAILGMCLGLVLFGGYPRSMAQDHSPDPAVQAEQLRELKEKLDSTNAQMQKQWDRVNIIDNSMTHLEGMMEGFGTLLTLMVGGSLTLQIRKKA